MATVIITFFLLVLVVAIMSIGVIMGRKPVQGSCGGLNQIEGMNDCEICGGNPSRCEESQANQG